MFTARLVDDGIDVDDLGDQSFLRGKSLRKRSIYSLERRTSRARRCHDVQAWESRSAIGFDRRAYCTCAVRKQEGDSIFRRISLYAAILVWAGLCDTAPGELILRWSPEGAVSGWTWGMKALVINWKLRKNTCANLSNTFLNCLKSDFLFRRSQKYVKRDHDLKSWNSRCLYQYLL